MGRREGKNLVTAGEEIVRRETTKISVMGGKLKGGGMRGRIKEVLKEVKKAAGKEGREGIVKGEEETVKRLIEEV